MFVDPATGLSQARLPDDERAALGLDEEVEARETRLLLQKACRQLASRDQELLRLRFYEEQSQAQIAATLGLSQMQISRRLRRICTTLRAAIGEIDEQTGISNAAWQADPRHQRWPDGEEARPQLRSYRVRQLGVHSAEG